MAYKNTVAIIGATTTIGAIVSKSLATNYRLLLMDAALSQLAALHDNIRSADANAEVETLNCCKDASWEADIIVVTNNAAKLGEIAANMKAVATCKPVLHLTTAASDTNKLQQLLPHSNVVTIVLSEPLSGTNVDAFIYGCDKETTDIAKMIVAAIACKQHTTEGAL